MTNVTRAAAVRRQDKVASVPRLDTVSATKRVLIVLEAFCRRSEWGVRELASEAGVSKSALHRTLQELADEGIISIDQSDVYRRSAGFMKLASELHGEADLASFSIPYLERLREKTERTAVFALYSATKHQYCAVQAAESARSVRYMWTAFQGWNDLHLGAGGKAILANLPPQDQQEIIAALADPIPALKSISKAELMRDLQSIRRVGWASSRGERSAGGRGVAAPVFDGAGEIIAVVVIAWPDIHGEEARVQETGAACLAAAQAMSHDLGFDGAHS